MIICGILLNYCAPRYLKLPFLTSKLSHVGLRSLFVHDLVSQFLLSPTYENIESMFVVDAPFNLLYTKLQQRHSCLSIRVLNPAFWCISATFDLQANETWASYFRFRPIIMPGYLKVWTGSTKLLPNFTHASSSLFTRWAVPLIVHLVFAMF